MGRQLTEEQRIAKALGDRFTELNTIFRVLRLGDREPNSKERERILKLRQEIQDLKRGKFDWGGNRNAATTDARSTGNHSPVTTEGHV